MFWGFFKSRLAGYFLREFIFLEFSVKMLVLITRFNCGVFYS